MKRIIALFSILLILALITGCAEKTETSGDDNQAESPLTPAEEVSSDDSGEMADLIESNDIEEDLGDAEGLEFNPDDFLM